MNPRFFDTRDEANICVAFHSVHIEQLNSDNTFIRCYDIKTLIILLFNIQKFSQSSVWLDMGLDYNNSRTFIYVKETADKQNYIRALPGICTFTKTSDWNNIKSDIFINRSIKWEKKTSLTRMYYNPLPALYLVPVK